MASSASEWLTVGEARKLLGISQPTMARLVREGKFRIYDGELLDKRMKLISRADVERLAGQPRGAKSGPKVVAVA